MNSSSTWLGEACRFCRDRRQDRVDEAQAHERDDGRERNRPDRLGLREEPAADWSVGRHSATPASAESRALRPIGVDDEHRHRAVVQDVVTDAAEQRSPNGAAAARAHHDEIVHALRDLADQRRADRLLAQHGGHGQVVGNALARTPKDRLGLRMRVFDQLPDLLAGRQVRGRGQLGHRGDQRQARVLAFGEVDRLRQRLLGVRRAVDRDQDVVEHDASFTCSAVLDDIYS